MRVGIAGLGSIGRRHVDNLLALGYDDIVAYDTDLNRCGVPLGAPSLWILALSMKSFWGAKPDCVLICTPPASHYELATEAFKHGCHTFIEKPLGLSLDGWKGLGQQFDEASLVNMCACNWRYAAGPQQIKQWLAEGVLGEILSARLYCGYSIDDRKDYKRSYVATTGAILDIGSHLADLALDWFGPARFVSATVKPATSIKLPKMDGAAEMLIAHESGVTSSIHVNLLQKHYRHTVEITGREGLIGYDFSTEHIYSRLWGKGYEDYRWRDNPDMFVSQLRHFLECVQAGRPADNPVSKAVKTLELLLEANEQEEKKL